jgi:hypothetical protein
MIVQIFSFFFPLKIIKKEVAPSITGEVKKKAGTTPFRGQGAEKRMS